MTTSAPVAAAPPARGRLGYIDWARGLAIVIMIQAHVVDSYTRVGDRGSFLYKTLDFNAGLAAPLFLMLAGLSVVLAAGNRARKMGDAAAAAATVRRRGWEIFGLAFLFRLQSFLLSPLAPPTSMLKVDILNIMGPSIVLAAVIWALSADQVRRLLLFIVCTLLIVLLTPAVRTSEWLNALPDPLEWYFQPRAGVSGFTFFPWTGFVLAGAAIGVLLESRAAVERAARFHGLMLGGAVVAAAGAYFLSFLPSLYPFRYPWGASPSFFVIRLGIITALLGVAYFWEQRPFHRTWAQFSPMREFGRSSLFVYWVHVELVYGAASHWLKKSLSVGWALVAFSLVTVAMFFLARLKNLLIARWRKRKIGVGSRHPTPISGR